MEGATESSSSKRRVRNVLLHSQFENRMKLHSSGETSWFFDRTLTSSFSQINTLPPTFSILFLWSTKVSFIYNCKLLIRHCLSLLFYYGRRHTGTFYADYCNQIVPLLMNRGLLIICDCRFVICLNARERLQTTSLYKHCAAISFTHKWMHCMQAKWAPFFINYYVLRGVIRCTLFVSI